MHRTESIILVDFYKSFMVAKSLEGSRTWVFDPSSTLDSFWQQLKNYCDLHNNAIRSEE